MNLIAATVQAATGCTPTLAALYTPHLADACVACGITTPQRLAAFLAQIGHESGSLKYAAELWGPTPAQARYEGRVDLGNVQAGDGQRFKGRGLIQVTGRFNYQKMRDRLRAKLGDQQVPDFETVPEALERPAWAAWSAAQFWSAHGCNELADSGDFEALTRRINGGVNGLADRMARWERAKLALDAPDQPTLADRQAAGPTPSPEPTEAPAPIPAPINPAPSAQQKEAPMGATFLWGLAQSLIGAFAPLAQEKISKEVARHTSNTAVADQIAQVVVDSAVQLTGKTDPIEAVAAAKSQPEVIQKIEFDALDAIDRLAPVLDKMAAWDRQAWDASEASADSAAARAKGDPNDQDAYLTRSVVRLVVGTLIGGAVLTAVLAYLKTDVQVILGALLALVSSIGGKFQTRYDHRYGSSRSSSSKDVVIAELNRRPKS